MDKPLSVTDPQPGPGEGRLTGMNADAQLAQGRSGAPRGPARILLVEDDYFIGLDTRDTLQAAGHVVVALVSAGEKALEVADRLLPDLAILDIRLAGELDGVEAALELRRRGIPCIFASAHTDEEVLKRGLRAEPLAWLTKPFCEAALLQAVAKALQTLQRWLSLSCR